jgi:hypothetical protein
MLTYPGPPVTIIPEDNHPLQTYLLLIGVAGTNQIANAFMNFTTVPYDTGNEINIYARGQYFFNSLFIQNELTIEFSAVNLDQVKAAWFGFNLLIETELLNY